MPTRVTLPSPGGQPVRPRASLAPRPESLSGRRLLLLDNGQITPSQHRFGPVLDWLAEDLEAALSPGGAPEFLRRAEDLVTFEAARVAALREEAERANVAGVVIAICHAGVTAPSSLLAGELERAGIPCVLIATALGRPLAETMAAYDVPGRQIVEAPTITGLAAPELRKLREQRARAVIEALTTPAEQLEERARAAGRGDPAAGEETLDIELPDQPAGAALQLDTALWERLEELRMSDGLPVVAPTPERVEAMLAATSRSPEQVLLDGPMPSGSAITVERMAVNAVLAGCRPEYFPVVIAAIEAMAAPEYRFFQAAITTHPGGTAVVVSGPLARELGIQSGPGALGAGFRANATIGRAINLAVINIARSIPGRSNLSTMGSPAQYSYCFAEDAESSPWPGLNTRLYDDETTSVTVLKCESPHNVLSSIGSSAEALLRSTAAVTATLGSNALRWPCEHLVIVNPALAAILDEAGYTKEKVAEYLFEHARVDAAPIPAQFRGAWPESFRGLDRIPMVEEPSQFIVVVAGAIGSQIMVAPPWGLSRAVTRPVAAD